MLTCNSIALVILILTLMSNVCLGWLPLQASKNQKENDKNVADSEKSEIIELQKGYSDLLQRVESLSVSISSMSENVFKLETMQVSSSALSDVKTQLSNLTDVVDILQKTSKR